MRLVSPNELYQAAKDTMLDGNEPTNDHDWSLVVNFWAANIDAAEVDACKLLKLLYQCPLSDKDVAQIARYQAKKKKKG